MKKHEKHSGLVLVNGETETDELFKDLQDLDREINGDESEIIPETNLKELDELIDKVPKPTKQEIKGMSTNALLWVLVGVVIAVGIYALINLLKSDKNG